MPRFSDNVYYYPFYLSSIKDQIIRDPDVPTTNDVTASGLPSSFSSILFKPWNYSENFDQVTSGNYISSISGTTPTYSTCPTHCNYCNTNECIQCASGYLLISGVCNAQTETIYYFLSPAYTIGTTTQVDLNFNALSSITTSVTISFFTKLLGWNVGTGVTTFDIFRYGIGINLQYDISSGDLNLYNSSNSVVYGTYSDFQSLIGSWVHISLAYYYDSTINAYFPSMLNFQVNFTPVAISGNYQSLSLSSVIITIPKESIAVYAKLWAWNSYLVGSWADMSNANRSYSPIIQLINSGSSTSNCISSSNLVTALTTNCVLDYSSILNESTYCSSAAYVNSSGCQTASSSCPYGYYSIYSNTDLCGCNMSASDAWISNNSAMNTCTGTNILFTLFRIGLY